MADLATVIGEYVLDERSIWKAIERAGLETERGREHGHEFLDDVITIIGADVPVLAVGDQAKQSSAPTVRWDRPQ